MKKYIMLLLALSLSLVFAACGNDDGDKKEAIVKPPEESKEDNKDLDEINDDSDKENTFVLIPLDQFIEKYNNLASLTDELKPLSKDEPISDDNTQILLNDDTYAVLAIFNEDNDSIFYSVGMTREDSYEELKGNGLYAALNLAATLDLDFEKMSNEFETALTKESHSYSDNGHMIMMENHKKSGESGLGMMVQVMKFFDEE